MSLICVSYWTKHDWDATIMMNLIRSALLMASQLSPHGELRPTAVWHAVPTKNTSTKPLVQRDAPIWLELNAFSSFHSGDAGARTAILQMQLVTVSQMLNAAASCPMVLTFHWIQLKSVQTVERYTLAIVPEQPQLLNTVLHVTPMPFVKTLMTNQIVHARMAIRAMALAVDWVKALAKRTFAMVSAIHTIELQ